jgi:hypothetical protein
MPQLGRGAVWGPEKGGLFYRILEEKRQKIVNYASKETIEFES